ncbi:hypothetical protein ACIHIX_35105 [Streptomyces sp. NPDC051913]
MYTVTGALISRAPIAWAGGSLAAGLLAAVVQGRRRLPTTAGPRAQ